MSTVQCTPGPAAPPLRAEDGTPATPHGGLCSSLHPSALAACALPPHLHAPRLREARPLLLVSVHSLAWLPMTT